MHALPCNVEPCFLLPVVVSVTYCCNLAVSKASSSATTVLTNDCGQRAEQKRCSFG